MDPDSDERLIGMLNRVLRDCGKLYRRCGTWMVRRHPTALETPPDQFVDLMEDLHRGLLIKVYVTTVRADDRWTSQEKKVAAAMIEYLWGQKLRGPELRQAATGLFQQADALTWESLVAPFFRYKQLADSKAQVETIVMRMANLVAKCDGQTLPEEAVALHTLQRDIDMALHPANPEETLAKLPMTDSQPQRNNAGDLRPQTTKRSPADTAQAHQKQASHPIGTPAPSGASVTVPDSDDRETRLAKAMEELDRLVGLQRVKQQVHSYTNFLKLQQTRRDKGLSTMPNQLAHGFCWKPRHR